MTIYQSKHVAYILPCVIKTVVLTYKLVLRCIKVRASIFLQRKNELSQQLRQIDRLAIGFEASQARCTQALTDGPFVPHIRSWEPWPPDLKILMTSGSKKGTQIYYFFSFKSYSKRTASRFLSGAPVERDTRLQGICISLKDLIKIPLMIRPQKRKENGIQSQFLVLIRNVPNVLVLGIAKMCSPVQSCQRTPAFRNSRLSITSRSSKTPITNYEPARYHNPLRRLPNLTPIATSAPLIIKFISVVAFRLFYHNGMYEHLTSLFLVTPGRARHLLSSGDSRLVTQGSGRDSALSFRFYHKLRKSLH